MHRMEYFYGFGYHKKSAFYSQLPDATTLSRFPIRDSKKDLIPKLCLKR